MNNHLTSILIDIIKHKHQRYNTCGDWFRDGEFLRIRVSQMLNPDYEFLIALHELVETYLSGKHGITEEEVDAFDINWKGEGEPGDCPEAPYYKEHRIATLIEKAMAETLGVDWTEYGNAIDKLDKEVAD
ncbi:MAG: hypothetical protein KGJ89_05100 [Patescibacteria group bacterium]|nr:hypothetical protein [Patescibacteria group bacterium]MDE2227299.1 hypothetical protein [Patescibacteria group bacterium]